MSVLEEYDERMKLTPLTAEEILKRVERAEACLTSPAVGDPRLHTERILVWLHDRLQAAYGAIEAAREVPQLHRCAWCWRAGPMTREAWEALPTMTMDEAGDHTQKCDHNPLVQRNRQLEAENERLGRDVNTVCANHQEEQREHAKTSLALREARAQVDELRVNSMAAIRELEAQAEDLRGRALGIDDGLRDAIRALLKSEASAGDLRRALWELVR